MVMFHTTKDTQVIRTWQAVNPQAVAVIEEEITNNSSSPGVVQGKTYSWMVFTRSSLSCRHHGGHHSASNPMHTREEAPAVRARTCSRGVVVNIQSGMRWEGVFIGRVMHLWGHTACLSHTSFTQEVSAASPFSVWQLQATQR